MKPAEGMKVHFCTTALFANQPATTNVNRSVWRDNLFISGTIKYVYSYSLYFWE